jgi:hypothetical protein
MNETIIKGWKNKVKKIGISILCLGALTILSVKIYPYFGFEINFTKKSVENAPSGKMNNIINGNDNVLTDNSSSVSHALTQTAGDCSINAAEGSTVTNTNVCNHKILPAKLTITKEQVEESDLNKRKMNIYLHTDRNIPGGYICVKFSAPVDYTQLPQPTIRKGGILFEWEPYKKDGIRIPNILRIKMHTLFLKSDELVAAIISPSPLHTLEAFECQD